MIHVGFAAKPNLLALIIYTSTGISSYGFSSVNSSEDIILKEIFGCYSFVSNLSSEYMYFSREDV